MLFCHNKNKRKIVCTRYNIPDNGHDRAVDKSKSNNVEKHDMVINYSNPATGTGLLFEHCVPPNCRSFFLILIL